MNNQNRLSLWPSLANTHRHEPNGPLRFPPELRCPRLSLVPILRSYRDPRRTFRLNSRSHRRPARLSGLSSRLVQPSARYRHLPGGWSQNLGGSLASARFSVLSQERVAGIPLPERFFPPPPASAPGQPPRPLEAACLTSRQPLRPTAARAGEAQTDQIASLLCSRPGAAFPSFMG